eukprot:scaffold549_cov385-Prasinococcus_capsulatus_cf.AAC.16
MASAHSHAGNDHHPKALLRRHAAGMPDQGACARQGSPGGLSWHIHPALALVPRGDLLLLESGAQRQHRSWRQHRRPAAAPALPAVRAAFPRAQRAAAALRAAELRLSATQAWKWARA